MDTYHNNKQTERSQEHMVNDHNRIQQTKLNEIDVMFGNVSQSIHQDIAIAFDDVIWIRETRFIRFSCGGFAIVIVAVRWNGCIFIIFISIVYRCCTI